MELAKPHLITSFLIMGMGRMGHNHLRVLSNLPGAKVVGYIDPIESAVGIQIPRFESIYSAPHFDCAIIASSTEQHEKNALEVIERGAHLFVEKPLSISACSGDKILQAARERGVKVFVGHVERFNPAVQKLHEVIRAGWLGIPIHFRFARLGGYPKSVSKQANVIFDLAVHDIDLFSTFAEKPKVHSCICHSSLQANIVDTAEILLKSSSGASASIHTNWITPTKIRTVQVTGTRGVCMLDYILQTCTLYGGNLLEERAEPANDFNSLIKSYQTTDKIEFGNVVIEPLKLELQALLQELNGVKTQLCTGIEAIETVRLAENAFRLSET